jgi:prevent-host-death family protein
MTIHVNIGEAKTRLSELIAAARDGELVIIANAGKPVAELRPIDPDDDMLQRRLSAYGMFKHLYDPDQVDSILAPLTDEELAEWYDGPIFPEGDDSDPSAA